MVDAKEDDENQSSCLLTFWIYGTAWDHCMAVDAENLRLISEERLSGPTRYQCMKTQCEIRSLREWSRRKIISCKGELTISQYINSKVHGYWAITVNDHSLHAPCLISQSRYQ